MRQGGGNMNLSENVGRERPARIEEEFFPLPRAETTSPNLPLLAVSLNTPLKRICHFDTFQSILNLKRVKQFINPSKQKRYFSNGAHLPFLCLSIKIMQPAMPAIVLGLDCLARLEDWSLYPTLTRSSFNWISLRTCKEFKLQNSSSN